LFRALRVDKLTIAALEATIGLYLRGDLNAIPALRMIYASKQEIAARAASLAERISAIPGFQAELEDGESVIGGGSTPGQCLPTKVIALTHATRSGTDIESVLRKGTPPIIMRVECDRALLDLRSVLEDQDEEIAEALKRLP
jgi:L-seryl-tRNA(Ser) seleniumtransferase